MDTIDGRPVAAPAQASSVPQSDARSQIQAQYDEYAAGFVAKDMHRIMAVLAADFQWKLVDGGCMSLEQTRAAIEQQVAATVFVHEMEITVDEAEIDGDQAVVRASEYMVAIMRSEDGGLDRMTSEETYRDTWSNTPEGWKLAVAEVLTSRAIIEPEETEA